MFTPEFLSRAERLLAHCRASRIKIATAESCTGGLVAGLLTQIAGSSAVVDRGFVTYSNAAKRECLGVPPRLLKRYGAVSRQTATSMAQGALDHSRADMAVAITGIAGPGGGSDTKPVGLVYIAARSRNGIFVTREYRFGDIGRDPIRLASVAAALDLLEYVSS